MPALRMLKRMYVLQGLLAERTGKSSSTSRTGVLGGIIYKIFT